MWRLMHARRGLVVTITLASITLLFWLIFFASDHREREAAVATGATPLISDGSTAGAEAKLTRKAKRKLTQADRAMHLARAQVWRAPPEPVSQVSFAGGAVDELDCRFHFSSVGGTTPKFDCVLGNGEEVRVKYGGPEVPSEAAATRLLRALGFLADDITLVRKLRCYGCPEEPFAAVKAVGNSRGRTVFEDFVNFDAYEEFEWVAVERKLDAASIETDRLEGWAFFELDSVDPRQGGAPRAHVDAIRLAALLLAHWDNKTENQRMVCLSAEWPEGTPCPQPFLMIQDVGGSFGPMKVDLEAWERTPVWEDRATCMVSMRTLPFGGATFNQAQITESGRLMFAALAGQLRDEQLHDLFTHARFAERRGLLVSASPVQAWVRAFKEKVRVITEGPPCPVA